MARLKIKDALILPVIIGDEKIPTGGKGDYVTTPNQLADYFKTNSGFATDQEFNFVDNKLKNHTENKSNPHNVTKDQLGLTNVENTSDIDKPVSNATSIILDTKADKSVTYTRVETDSKLSLKADKSVTYTKVETNDLLSSIKDKGVTTWSGRTQEDKNKENPSPADYGATGNGVADDTAAFVALEAAYQGRVIDLLGKNYKVTRSFTLNKYVNGVFIIGDLVANKKPEQSKLSIDMGLLGQDSNSYLYRLIRSGTGSDSVVQSVVVDEVNNYAYTMVLTSGQTTETINRLDLRDGNRLVEKDKYVFSNLGHQGMTLEYTVDGSSRLWLSASVGGKAYRTLYDPVAPVQEEYILMDNTGTSTNPFISADQRFLCARSQVTIEGNLHLQIHIFDLAYLVENGAGDYRGKELYKFSARYEIDGELRISSQGLACDGEFIYIIGGSSGVAVKNTLVVFDFFGNQVAINKDVKIGNAMAQTIGTGTFVERESLFWHNINGVQTLCNNIVMGDTGGRETYVYALNKVNDRPVVSYSMNDKPCFSACSNNNTSLHYSVAGNLPTDTDLNIGWTYRGTSKLYAKLNGTTNVVYGAWVVEQSTSAQAGLVLNYDGAERGALWSSSSNMGVRSAQGLDLSLTAANVDTTFNRWSVSAASGEWYPEKNALQNIGKASRLIGTVYASTGTINTSDERYKQQFRSLDEREKAAALEIKNSICLFKFNDAVDLKGDGARWHVGVKAQQVISIMSSHGLDWQEYGFICFDEWDEKPEEIETWDDEFNEEGDLIRANGSQVINDHQEGGSRYAIRYDELSMFILSAI